MTQETEREAFETQMSHIYAGLYMRDPNCESSYKNDRVQSAWCGWQARARVGKGEVESLPDFMAKSDKQIWAEGVQEFGSPDAALAEAERIRNIIKRVTDEACVPTRDILSAKPVEVGVLAEILYGKDLWADEWWAELAAAKILERFNVTEKPPQEAKDE